MKALNLLRYSLIAVVLTVAAPAWSEGDAARGQDAAAAKGCVSCHGEKGDKPMAQSPDPIPLLAGQHADYLAKALHDYKSGARKNPTMSAMAGALSEEDIADLTAYFASQQGLKTPPIK